jgi:hypothetical protein
VGHSEVKTLMAKVPESKPSKPELSPGEIESMIRIRDAAERELLWKYSFAAIFLGTLLSGSALLGIYLVKQSTDSLIDTTKLRVGDIVTLATDTRKEFIESQKQWKKERLDAIETLQELETKAASLEVQAVGLRAAVANTEYAVNAAAELAKSINPDSISLAAKEQLANLNIAVANANDFVENSKFTIFPHYRPQVSASVDLRQDVRRRLSEKGFVVARDEGDSEVKPGSPSNGARVDFFTNPNIDAAEQKTTTDMAQKVLKILNDPPTALGPFGPNPHQEKSYGSQQQRYFGVWF